MVSWGDMGAMDYDTYKGDDEWSHSEGSTSFDDDSDNDIDFEATVGSRRRRNDDQMTRRRKKTFAEPFLIAQPSIVVGMWLLEAGPADGNWSSFGSMMIISSTRNAARYMMGQSELDLSGFALHPNPADTYHAGSVNDWAAKGCEIPDVVRNSVGAPGVRYRPFGGDNDGGEFVWICGQMVAKSNDAVVFLCVDLLSHGPIRADGIKRLEEMGVFDRFKAGDPDALVAKPPRQSPPSSDLCKARLNEFEQVRDFPAQVGFDFTHVSQVTPPTAHRRLGLLGGSFGKKNHDDFECIDLDSIDGETRQVSDLDSDHKHLDELDADMVAMDLNNETVWATLVQGSRVL